MTSDTKWIAVLSSLMLFTGILLGIAMDRLLFRPSPTPYVSPWAMKRSMGSRAGERGLAQLTAQLSLKDDQKEKMQEIFRRYMPRLRQALRERGNLEPVRREMRAEVAKVLTPAQLQKFDEMVQRREQRRMLRHEQMPEPVPAPPSKSSK